MTLTVGIVTLGEDPRTLCETITGVIQSATQVSEDAEVLVVVNGRGRIPELDSVSSPLLRVRYLDQRGVALARNTVLAEARHDTILFTDDDCAVPPQWCGQLANALWEPGCPVVSAPVRMAVAGPVSAYLDYQRAFNPVPAGPDHPMLLVTTNCGLRRDLIPATLRFDTRLHTAGEDTSFALALGKAGIVCRWLADAIPIRHASTEEIEEITGRFLRYARHGVQLFLTQGYADAAVPGALAHYRQQFQATSQYDRRFSELVAAPVRTAFAVYDQIAVVAGTIGYLDQLGTELDHPLLALDLAKLNQVWHEIGIELHERTATLTASQWASLDVDYLGMRERLGEPEPLLAELRDAQWCYARPIPDDPDGPIGDLLNHGTAEVVASFVGSMERVRQAYDSLCAQALDAEATALTPDRLDQVAHAAGVSFRVAMHSIEMSMLLNLQRLTAVRSRRTVAAPPAGGGR